MTKIKVAFYSHQIDFAGTWRSHERIADILQRDPRFKVSILYADTVEHNRLQAAKEILLNCNFVQFKRSLQKTGPNEGWRPLTEDIGRVAKENDIHILHFARSGYYEWPFTSRICPVQVETNIFGYRDTSPYLDGTIFIGRCLMMPENKNSVLIPNPIPGPSTSYEDLKCLRSDLQLSEDMLVFGRIGRPANFTPISLIAYKAFIKNYTWRSKYLLLGGCDDTRRCVQQLGLESDVIFLDCTNEDSYIERFHKTIDVFAHYRSDGEICSTAIAQAMMYGKPVITHIAGKNGQIEWLGTGGFYAKDSNEYYKAMVALADQDVRRDMSFKAKNFATSNFEQKTIVEKVIEFYLSVARSKNCEF